MSNAVTTQGLNRLLADTTVLYEKLHAFHWYVSGPQFFVLHEKFEELYNRFAAISDDLAERILTVSGKPVATLREVLDLADIAEYDGATAAQDMVATLVRDLDQLLEKSARVIESAESAGDRGTVNLLDGFRDEWQKTRWMLNAWQSA